jgi:hypothetical protein
MMAFVRPFTRAAAVTAVALCALLTGQAASAMTYSFQCVSNNDPGDCAIAEAQISMEVVAGPGVDQVSFEFTNSGPEVTTLARIYFDDGSLNNLADIINDPLAGVEFATDPSPPDLPGANNVSPPFVATQGFNSGATSPPPTMGIENFSDPNFSAESVTMVFDLDTGQDLQDVLNDLSSGALRAGVHVINFSTEGSEGLVNIPEPASGALLGLGLAGLAALLRRRSV